MDTLELMIGDMDCIKCADRLEGLLNNTIGVKRAAVSFEDGRGKIAYRAQSVDADQLIAAIRAAGFSAEKA
ncbi:MAG: heavy-metal-associated domain-containing protein [Paracoccaceae bacterium]